MLVILQCREKEKARRQSEPSSMGMSFGTSRMEQDSPKYESQLRDRLAVPFYDRRASYLQTLRLDLLKIVCLISAWRRCHCRNSLLAVMLTVAPAPHPEIETLMA